MQKWSRNLLAGFLLLVLAAIVAPAVVYTQTRASYHAVGVNDGRIQQRMEIAEIIQKQVQVSDCRDAQNDSPPIMLLTVKSESLYLIPIDGKFVTFCR